jgi:hypothetical protein
LARTSEEDERAQEEYDELYYALSDEQDFEVALQSTGPSSFQVDAVLETGGDIIPALKGKSELSSSQKARVEEMEDEDDSPFSHLHPDSPFTLLEEVPPPNVPVPNVPVPAAMDISSDTPIPLKNPLADTADEEENTPKARNPNVESAEGQSEEDSDGDQALPKAVNPKFALNHRTRRRLAREIKACNYRIISSSGVSESRPLIELRKHMARPGGSSFLGSKATEAHATVGSLTADPIIIIVDTGSDITLISRKTLAALSSRENQAGSQRESYSGHG